MEWMKWMNISPIDSHARIHGAFHQSDVHYADVFVCDLQIYTEKSRKIPAEVPYPARRTPLLQEYGCPCARMSVCWYDLYKLRLNEWMRTDTVRALLCLSVSAAVDSCRCMLCYRMPIQTPNTDKRTSEARSWILWNLKSAVAFVRIHADTRVRVEALRNDDYTINNTTRPSFYPCFAVQVCACLSRCVQYCICVHVCGSVERRREHSECTNMDCVLFCFRWFVAAVAVAVVFTVNVLKYQDGASFTIYLLWICKNWFFTVFITNWM